MTLVGVSKDVNECRRSVRSNSRHGINFECLTADHYLPEVLSSSDLSRLILCTLSMQHAKGSMLPQIVLAGIARWRGYRHLVCRVSLHLICLAASSY